MNFISSTLLQSWTLFYQACRKNKWGTFALILALCGVVVGIILNLVIPLAFKNIINQLMVDSSVYTIFFLVAIYSLTWTFSQVIEQVREILICPMLEKTITQTTLQYYMRLLKSASYSKSIGKELNILYFFQEGFPNLLWGVFFYMIPTALQVFSATLILHVLYGFAYSSLFFLLMLCFVSVTVYGIKVFLLRQSKAISQSSLVSELLTDRLINREIVNLFSTEDREFKNLYSKLEKLEFLQTKAKIGMETLRLTQGIIVGIGLSIATVLSAFAVNSNLHSLGDFILINGYIIQLIVPMSSLGFILTDISKGLSGVHELMDFFKNTAAFNEKEIKQSCTVIDINGIDLKRVNFSYPQKNDRSRQILFDFNLKLEPYCSVVFVGASGSGKTTVTRLLSGEIFPNKGSIVINGNGTQDLLEHNLPLFSVVPQSVSLLNDSLLNNLLIANPSATQNQIQRAISFGCLEDLLERLPKGLETKVGELGHFLSGGEKQRIAIARAFLKEPFSGLIFDEATSSLDSSLTYRIIENFLVKAPHPFKIMITHQRDLIEKFDKVVFIDNGRIVSQGDHFDLLKSCKRYRDFWHSSLNIS
jgi:ABC-type multidrug transport system fused ATPase/permease subunit